MQTFALTLAPWRCRSLSGSRSGSSQAARPVPAGDHAGARRDADRPRLRVPDADRAPLLGRPGAARDPTLIYSCRRRSASPRSGSAASRPNTVEAAEALGATRLQALFKVQLPLARRHAPPRGEPDDPLRALDGRHRRADRRPGPRRRRHERSLLEPGARDPRGRRDRDHGDRARPCDRGDGDPHRSDASPSHRASASGGSASSRSPAPPAVGLPSALGYAFGRERLSTRAGRRRTGCCARIQCVLDYVQNPGTFVFRITEPIGNFLVEYGLVPLRSFFVETPWPSMLSGLRAIAFFVSGLRPARDGARRCSRRSASRRVGTGDGHALAGARRDGAAVVLGHRARRLGRGEPARVAERCDRSTTCCRRCRSSSTSSRSST